MSSAVQKNIFERMRARKLTITALEKKAGLKPQAVRNILHGHIKKPAADTLQAIAKALDCTIIDIMEMSPSTTEALIHQDDEKTAEQSTKEEILIVYPKIIAESSQLVSKYLEDHNYNAALNHYFEIIKQIYLYTTKKENKEIDPAFVEWLLENQFNHDR